MVSISCFGVRVSVMFHFMFVLLFILLVHCFSITFIISMTRQDVPVGVPLDLSSL